MCVCVGVGGCGWNSERCVCMHYVGCMHMGVCVDVRVCMCV